MAFNFLIEVIGLFYMPKRNREFTRTIIHLCERERAYFILFYNYLKNSSHEDDMSFSLFKASPPVLLSLKYFEKHFFIIFDWKKGLILLLQYVTFENGHT